MKCDRVRRVTLGPPADFDPTWSPSGRFLAYERSRRGRRDIAVVPVAGGRSRLVSPSDATEADPTWTPAGDIVFESDRSGSFDLYLSQRGRTRRLTRGPANDFHPDVSRDGDRVVFERAVADRYDLFVLDLAGGKPRRLTADDADNAEPAWSPEGDRVVFAGTRDGPYELYVVDVATRDVTKITNADSGDHVSPSWGRARVGAGTAASAGRASRLACKTTGTAGRDPLLSDSGIANVICGLGGNDDLFGRTAGGGDRLLGDPGKDLMWGGGAADILHGGENHAGKGTDQLRGGPGNDSLYARGDGDRDCVWGGDGNSDDAWLTPGFDNKNPAPTRIPAWDTAHCGGNGSIEGFH